MSNRIYVAIDTPDLERAKGIATRVRRHVGGIKLGLEFFCANGRHGVQEMHALGLPIFLDLKLHDIPNTVAKAVQALHGLDPAILTVHASGGRAMLEDAKAAAPTGTKVVAVTMLTSLDERDLTDTGITGSAHDQVLRLTDLAMAAGIDGIVCSGAEVAAAHRAWPKGFFVVPGVRPADGHAGDQKRVVTPRQAIDGGASILVVGRPITQADDPDHAAREIAATLWSHANGEGCDALDVDIACRWITRIARDGAFTGKGSRFDCAKATHPARKLICATPDLSALDTALADAYRATRAALFDKSAIKQQQREWQARLRADCATGCDAALVIAAYRKQKDRIAGIRDETYEASYKTADVATLHITHLDARQFDFGITRTADDKTLCSLPADDGEAGAIATLTASTKAYWQAGSCRIDFALTREADGHVTRIDLTTTPGCQRYCTNSRYNLADSYLPANAWAAVAD